MFGIFQFIYIWAYRMCSQEQSSFITWFLGISGIPAKNVKIKALVVVAKEGLLQVFGFYIKLVAECFLLLRKIGSIICDIYLNRIEYISFFIYKCNNRKISLQSLSRNFIPIGGLTLRCPYFFGGKNLGLVRDFSTSTLQLHQGEKPPTPESWFNDMALSLTL